MTSLLIFWMLTRTSTTMLARRLRERCKGFWPSKDASLASYIAGTAWRPVLWGCSKPEQTAARQQFSV
jgi:hypothetical protein